MSDTRVIDPAVLAASLEKSAGKIDNDSSSLKLKHLHDLQVVHKAVDVAFDHLTTHITDQDATIRELRRQLAEERAAFAAYRANALVERETALADVKDELATARHALQRARESSSWRSLLPWSR